MSIPEIDWSQEWSEPSHYAGSARVDKSADRPTTGAPAGDPPKLDRPAEPTPEPVRSSPAAASRMPLAGPGDSAILAVALATGSDAVWSPPRYHGPRRHRPDVRAFQAPADKPETRPPEAPPEQASPEQAAPEQAPERESAVQPASDRTRGQATQSPSVMASSAKMAVASVASRLTGFVRTLALAAALGSADVSGAYNLANTLPNMVYELMLGGVLTSVVIPVLVKAQADDADDGVGYTQRLLSIAVSGLAFGTLIAVLAAPLLIDIFGGSAPERAVGTLWATLLLPEIFFYGLGAILSAVLNTRNVYGWPAWAPVVNNIITIVAIGLFILIPGPAQLTTSNITNTQILVIGIGTTLGIAGQAVILLVPLRRLGFRWDWRLRARPEEAGRMAEFRNLSLWVLGYVAISQVGVIVVNHVANSLLISGRRSGVTIFTNADLLFQVPYGILGVSLLTALMPRMSRAAAAGNVRSVLEDLRLGARLSAVALVPITAGLIVFGPAFTSVILLGHYQLADARLTGIALAASAFGLLPFALVMLQQRVFYAMRDTRTPTMINLVMVAVKVVLVIAAGTVLPDRYVVIALTVSTALSYLAGAVVGHRLLQRRFGHLGFRPVGRTVAWIGLASLGAGLVGLCVVLLGNAALGVTRASALAELAAGGVLSVIVLVIIASRLPLPEVSAMLGAVKARRSRSA